MFDYWLILFARKTQNWCQAACRLLEDLEEQLESVPIIIPVFSELAMVRDKKSKLSWNSSSFPAVGAYREIAKMLHSELNLILIAENLS